MSDECDEIVRLGWELIEQVWEQRCAVPTKAFNEFRIAVQRAMEKKETEHV